VVVHSDHATPGLPWVAKGHVDGLVPALGLDSPSGASLLLGASVAGFDATVVALWEELCRSDPELPLGSRPPVATSVVSAVTGVLGRARPLEWGVDGALEPVAGAFALNVGSVDVALEQLTCLREAFQRTDAAHGATPASATRLATVVERMMVTAARALVGQLEQEAMVDPLTGLGNRRAYERDLARQLSRARRHEESVGVALVHLGGLGDLNRHRGYAAGDEALRALGRAIVGCLRVEDVAYRLGGEAFAVVFPERHIVEPELLGSRLRAAGAPEHSIGLAVCPPDRAELMLEVADRRRRGAEQGPSRPDHRPGPETPAGSPESGGEP
ncbi:MAG TPA: GGDEF domain-containing protein, partial [Acidimicrobiales bacterium]|nr:GGDEF domain-containing protein [Acidimicrobiales bacterium]